MDRLNFYANQINQVLIRRKVINSPLTWAFWAGPDSVGPKSYAFAVDLREFPGKRIEVLHHQSVMADISTLLGGLKVSYVNHQGFCYIVKEEKIAELDPVDLVKFLTNAPCALIVGARGTGKTSVLQHVVKARKHKVIVFDPKAIPGKWLNAEVYGAGANYKEIWEKLQELSAEFQRRSKQLQHLNGKEFERLLLIIDEWWITNKRLPQAAEIVFEIVTIGREVGMDVFLCSATKTVQGLGIEGEGNLRDAFEVVLLSKVGNGFRVDIETEQGLVRANHPGPFKTGIELSKDDRILVAVAVRANNGSCAINRIDTIIKEKLPARFWQGENATFTYHRLQEKFAQWESLGLLTKPGRQNDGTMVGRMVTEELRRLAGV